MRRINKLMAVLLSLSMCLSLLPVSALADETDTLGPLENYDEYKPPVEIPDNPWGEGSEGDTAEIVGAISDSLEEKIVDGLEETAGEVNDAVYDAIHPSTDSTDPGTTEPDPADPGTTEPDPTDPGTTDPDPADPGTTEPDPADPGTTEPGTTEPKHHTAADVTNGIPKEGQANPPEFPNPVNPPVKGDSSLQVADKVADVAEALQDAVTKAVTVTVEGTDQKIDEVVGEVVRNADGTINVGNSSGKALEIAQAADTAAAAATNANTALTNAQNAVTNRDQAALDRAKDDAQEAFNAADKALGTANAAYTAAQDAVTAAENKYKEALQHLKDAGYEFDFDVNSDEPIEAVMEKAEAAKAAVEDALIEAKAAVDKAQEGLDEAKAILEETQKQREYANVYAMFTTALAKPELKFPADGSEPSWDSSKMEEALGKLVELYKDYGEKVPEDKALATITDIFASGNSFSKAYFDSSSWDWKNLTEQQTIVQDWESKHIDPNEYEDTLYKVFKFLIDENVSGSVDLGFAEYESSNDKALREAASGIVKFWEAEKALKGQKEKLETEGLTVSELGGKDLLAGILAPADSKALLEKIKNNELSDEVLANAKLQCLEKGKPIVVTIGGETYTASLTSDGLYNTSCAQLLDQVYRGIFTEEVPSSFGKKTPYQIAYRLSQSVTTSEKVDNLVRYLDLLRYELKCRASAMTHDAVKERLDLSLDRAPLDNMLYALGYESGAANDWRKTLFNQLNKDHSYYENHGFLAWYLRELSEIDPTMTILDGLQQNPEFILMVAIGYSGQESIEDFLTLAQTKKDAADAAIEALNKAQEAYQMADDAVKDAQKRLNALLEKAENESKTSFAKAIADAEARLLEAEAAEATAKAERDAAEAAQQAAKADYEEAMRLAIDALPDIPDLFDTDDDDDDDTDGTGGGDAVDAGVIIEDQLVPLASGPVTRAQFVDYLWRHEGSPAADLPTFPDVPADHEFAPAVGWAQANSLVNGYEDGTFLPDELVTVSDVRAILGRFAGVFSTNAVDAAALTTLTGEDGEAVLNCDEVLAEFFGEEYIPAVDQDSVEADTAA